MKLPIPDDWISPDDYSIMLVCVPNSVQWRAIVKGAIYELTRGRKWDEKTGSIKDTQIISKEIWESVCMATCEDILAVLTRIADNMDGGSSQRYTMAEMTQALSEIGGGFDISDFTDILEFITVLTSKLPSLQHTWSVTDLISMAFQSRYRASHLNYLEDIALSQRGINLATGGLPNQLIYENLGDLFNAGAAGVTGGQSAGVQWIWQIIKGKDIQITQDFLDLFNWLFAGSVREGIYDIETATALNIPIDYATVYDNMLTALQAANPNTELGNLVSVVNGVATQIQSSVGGVDTSLQNMTDVHNELKECVCAMESGGCTCGAVTGEPIFELEEQLETECVAPSGFADWDEYIAYRQSFACWVLGVFVSAAGEVGSLDGVLGKHIQKAWVQGRYSIRDVFNDLATYFENVWPLTVSYNTPYANKSTMTTVLTQQAASMLDAVVTAGSEGDPESIFDDYFTTPSLALQTALNAAFGNGDGQSLTEGTNSSDVSDSFLSWIETSFTNGINGTYILYEPMIDYFQSVITYNLVNYAFNPIPEIQNFVNTCTSFTDPCAEPPS